MAIKHRFNTTAIFLVLALLIICTNFLVMQGVGGPVTSTLALATYFDLTICLPLAFYFLMKRRKGYSLKAVITVAVLGFLYANYIVPNDVFHVPLGYLVIVEAFFITIELVILFLLLRHLPKLVAAYKEHKLNFHYQEALSRSFHKIYGDSKILKFFVFDFSVIFYGLFCWRKKQHSFQNPDKVYSFHKNTGYFGFFIMIVHALAIEIFAVHFTLIQFNHILAWVVTFFDVYTLLFFIADYHAIRLAPIIIADKQLHLQVGVKRSMVVPVDKIRSIEVCKTAKKIREKEKNAFFVTLPELDEINPQYEVLLKESMISTALFGFKRKIDKIYVTVDQPNEFYDEICQNIVQDDEDK